MTESLTITLAGASFTVRRLTLRQMRDLQIGSAQALSAPEGVADRIALAYDADIGIIVCALSRDNPDVTAEALYDMETTRQEIGAAAVEILKFSGLVKSGEGEAPAPGAE